MKEDNVIGSFNYREPQVLYIRRAPKRFPKVTLHGNLALKPLFPYFLELVNSLIELDLKRDHKISVEQVGGEKSTKFKFTIDGKRIVMASLRL